jgi:hypothetical protein
MLISWSERASRAANVSGETVGFSPFRRDRREFSVETRLHVAALSRILLDKTAAIGHKEQLFTGFQVVNHNRMLEFRVRFGYFETT